MTPRFKLPQPFQDAHGAMLAAWDWARRPEMPLAETLPNVPDLALVVLEAIARGSDTVIRSKGARNAVRVRNYADKIAATQEAS